MGGLKNARPIHRTRQFNRDTFARMINRVESLYEKETIGIQSGGGRIEASR